VVTNDAALAHLTAIPPSDLGATRGFPGDLTSRAPQGLPVHPALTRLFPDGMLRRGSVLGITGRRGSVALLLALISQPTTEGSWAAIVGIPALGIEAASALGVPLDHLVLVPDPGGRWPEVVGVLLDAVDLVAIGLPSTCRAADARRLAARARERRSVLAVVTPPKLQTLRWPEPIDLQLQVTSAIWDGLAVGDGVLRRRQVVVQSSGRRSAGRERTVQLWLPTAEGHLAAVDHEQHRISDPVVGHPSHRSETRPRRDRSQPPDIAPSAPINRPMAG